MPSPDNLLHFLSSNFLVQKVFPVKSKNVTWLIAFIYLLLWFLLLFYTFQRCQWT